MFQNIDIIEDYGPNIWSSWRATTSTRWITRSCCSSTVDSGADVTVGCLEVPRMEAIGVRRDACRRAATAIIDFVEKPADPPAHARQARTSRSPRWASTCSRRKFLIEQLRRDAATAGSSRDFGKDIIPYIVKHGTAVAHRFAALLRPLGERSRRLLARCRHDRCLLGGEHRPDRRRARSSTSTTATGRSGPMRRSPRRPSSSTTSTAGAARR